MDFRPTCSGVLIKNHTQSFCKLFSGNPKLTVKCLTGKRFGKPRRSMNRVTLAGDQLTACSECAYTVKFFTHPPVPNVISLFPGFCKHQRWCQDTRLESKELLLIGIKKPISQNVFNQGNTIVSGKDHPPFFCIPSQHFNLLLIRFIAETFYRNTMGVLPFWALGF